MSHVGREQVVRIGGGAYKLSRLSRSLVARWLAWAEPQIPDSLAGLERLLEALEPSIAAKVALEATRGEKLRGSLQDERFWALWCSREGMAYTFWLLLERHHPEISEGEAAGLFDRLEEDPWELIETAQGKVKASAFEIELRYLSEIGLLAAPPEGQDPTVKRVDWQEVDRSLSEARNLTPQQIDEMTLPEIAVICHQSPAFGEDLIAPYLRAMGSLTATQRLELARRKLA